MGTIELVCVGLLALGTLLRARAPGFREWVRDAPLVLVAAWLGEDTNIRAYDFYAYAPSWHAFLDVTPLLVPTIWVFVVLSARDVARALAPGDTIALGYLLVFVDASFIEPICTHAGLWRWHQPGPFDVPLIGTLGWTFFGGSLLFCMERLRGRARVLSLLLAPLMMHALLIAGWWGGLRWLGARVPVGGVWVALSVGALVAFSAALWRTGRLGRVDLGLILPRLGPAAFFFTLLRVYDAPPLLWVYSLAFAVPWIAATRWRPALTEPRPEATTPLL